MSDGIKSAAVSIGEAVVKPVIDELGKAIEEGVSSVISGPQVNSQDPQAQQNIQQKQAEEQKRIAWAKHVIDWNKQIEEAQAKVRKEAEQKKQQQTQGEQQKEKVEQFKLVEKKEKQQLTATQVAQRQTELKRGVGG